MSGVRKKEVRPEEDGMRLGRWLKTRFPDMPHGRMHKALRKGEVRLDGGRARTDTRVVTGQTVRVPPYDPAPVAGSCKSKGPDPQDEAFVKKLVVFRNAVILGINKPPGLAVQGGSRTGRHLDGMLGFLSFNAPERPRLVHRLDKDTSGVMLLARTREVATVLSEAFKGRRMKKIYWAVTAGVPDADAGTINLPLAKRGGACGERVVADPENGQSAVTDFAVLDRAGEKAALVVLRPQTGRTHQIRAHLAAVGTPILGDGKYGGKQALQAGNDMPKCLHLHARSLTLPPHVPGAGTRIVAPPPQYFKTTLDLFEFETPGPGVEDSVAVWRE